MMLNNSSDNDSNSNSRDTDDRNCNTKGLQLGI